MCLISSREGGVMTEFEIADSRLDKAVAIIRTAKERIDMETLVDIFFELGLGEALRTVDGDKLELEPLTGVQLVAVAAAIGAVAENGAKRTINVGSR